MPHPDDPQFDVPGIKRLRGAMDFSYRELSTYRENRLKAISEFVGSHYGPGGAKRDVPVNMLELAITTYRRQLVANQPRVQVFTPHQELKASAANLELAVNHLIEEIDLAGTLKRLVVDALFGMGICKVGIHAGSQVEIGGFLHDVGQPFAETVDMDDFVYDTNAKKWEQITFAGNRYRVPLDDARNSMGFDPQVASELRASTRNSGVGQATGSGQRAADVSHENASGEIDEYRDHVDLWDVWLPQENRVATMSVDQEELPLLRSEPWNGPELGMYVNMGFTEVPDNVLPLPPVAVWMDMHLLSNSIHRKLGAQAERQKSILATPPSAGDAIKKTNDGDIISAAGAEQSKEMRFGGIDQTNLAFFLALQQQFNRQAGNLDALGGLSAQSETLGQDQLLTENASQRLADMQATVVDVTAKIVKALAQYLWTDPLIELPLVKSIAGTDIKVPFTWTPEDREGDFLQYNFRIEPYSMQHRTPGARLQTISSIWQQFILPLLPALEQQGIGVNYESTLRLVAKYADLPEIEDMLQFVGPSLTEERGPVGQSSRPAQTTRTNVRVNRSGGTQQGQNAAMMQTLMGAGIQDGQAASLAGAV